MEILAPTAGAWHVFRNTANVEVLGYSALYSILAATTERKKTEGSTLVTRLSSEPPGEGMAQGVL